MNRQTGITKSDLVYPGFLNLAENEDGTFTLLVRGDPTSRPGIHICGFARDRGLPGRCTPGDENCNNYCNMAPQKGPMAPCAKPTTQIQCGSTAALRLTAEQVREIVHDFGAML